ncbi:hypothetical protein K2173_010555 [Erythroxylum novogranatense]|uniref:Dirigent protein n=1 Tax=Erythroxylum novogranatense TaxID=1862640 RepID=A0AAV8TF90_9ROSI|nr:hypothetical protein K2173_010555 [Erythroxylum novogranatense]
MVKLCLVLLIISLVATATWANRVASPKHKTNLIHLQFYFHDRVTGNDITAVRVVSSPLKNSATFFGNITISDDPLTEGPDPNSKLVGRAQGLYASVGRDTLCLFNAYSFYMTNGIYNGSSFNVFGRNPTPNKVREVSIVGGTGAFRGARGFAILNTYYVSATIAVVGYNVTISLD